MLQRRRGDAGQQGFHLLLVATEFAHNEFGLQFWKQVTSYQQLMQDMRDLQQIVIVFHCKSDCSEVVS
jgi:hypothetical protein